MRTFDFRFDDVPLVIGADKETGARHCIALIAGNCEIVFRSDDYDIRDVTLLSPIKGDVDVAVPMVREATGGYQLWKWVTESIIAACEDAILVRIEEIEKERRA